MDNGLERIASILRISKQSLSDLSSDLEKITGKTKIIEQISEENETSIRKSLDFLGLGRNVSAGEVYDALISKIESDDNTISSVLNYPRLNNQQDIQKILDLLPKIYKVYHPDIKGWFLKRSVAEKLLRSKPPQKIMEALGYKTVDDLLAKEDLFEVFSALRFLEDPDWLNTVFFDQYRDLIPEDFEEREIMAKALNAKWVSAAEKFIKKKYHNVSHLKELGVIFVIPVSLDVSGELLRLLCLLFHYGHEILFYSALFKRFAAEKTNFTENLVSLLRGDTLSEKRAEHLLFQKSKKPRFLIIQRYLAKDDINDWRLFAPHVNPEAEHWHRAEQTLALNVEQLLGIKDGLSFWRELGWVGDYFKDETGNKVLVSFNLVDTIMSLVKEKEMAKYLYHHQEALWNKFYTSYFSEEQMLEKVNANIIKGWFEV